MKQFMMVIVVFSFCSCYAPYSFRVKPIESNDNRLRIIMQLATKFPYVVVHDSTNTFKLSNMSINENANQITGKLETLPATRTTYSFAKEGQVNKAQRGLEKPFDEMHIRVINKNWQSGEQIYFSDTDISSIHIYQAVSSGGGRVIIGASILAVIGLVLLSALYLKEL